MVLSFVAVVMILICLGLLIWACWYGVKALNRVQRDPTEAIPGPYDDGFKVGEDDGYHDGYAGEASRPDLGADADGSQYAKGYYDGYHSGYAEGKDDWEEDEPPIYRRSHQRGGSREDRKGRR